jgi:hypothetical protein
MCVSRFVRGDVLKGCTCTAVRVGAVSPGQAEWEE